MAMLGAAMGMPVAIGMPMGMPVAMGIMEEAIGIPMGAAAIGIMGAAIGIPIPIMGAAIPIMGAAIPIMGAAGATGIVVVTSAGVGTATGLRMGIGILKRSNTKPRRVFCLTVVVIVGIGAWG